MQGGLEEWATTSRRIDMDALRISPDCEAFSGGNRETGVARLTAVLRAYALRDAATGYCQGMSDLAAPLIYLFPSSDEQVSEAEGAACRQGS